MVDTAHGRSAFVSFLGMSTIFKKNQKKKIVTTFHIFKKDFIYTEELPKDHYTSKKILLGVFYSTLTTFV